jgi:hypothetical protein
MKMMSILNDDDRSYLNVLRCAHKTRSAFNPGQFTIQRHIAIDAKAVQSSDSHRTVTPFRQQVMEPLNARERLVGSGEISRESPSFKPPVNFSEVAKK